MQPEMNWRDPAADLLDCDVGGKSRQWDSRIMGLTDR
jgi:hypothetical protein